MIRLIRLPEDKTCLSYIRHSCLIIYAKVKAGVSDCVFWNYDLCIFVISICHKKTKHTKAVKRSGSSFSLNDKLDSAADKPLVLSQQPLYGHWRVLTSDWIKGRGQTCYWLNTKAVQLNVSSVYHKYTAYFHSGRSSCSSPVCCWPSASSSPSWPPSTLTSTPMS